jgi:galactose mutarotase-like enzyme
MSDSICIRNETGDEAEIDLFGAELRAWRVGGEDMLWSPQAEIWDRTAPILFPVVGWTRDSQIRVGEKSYPLGLHGFAWKKRFAVAEQGDDYLRLALSEDEETRSLYPFAFRLEVEFRLSAGTLEKTLIVANSGEEAAPYACGLHPAFRWPLAGSDGEHAILFEGDERSEVPVIAPGGLFSVRRRPVPLEGRRLPISPSLLADEALCFLDANSRRIEYRNENGACLTVELRDFPHIALWSLPPAPFLCIEAWTGHGDPEDFAGDVFEKPSMRRLLPGEEARHAAIFRFEKRERFE